MARSDRLDAAIAEGVLDLPETGPIALCLPPAELDLSWAPADRVQIIHHMKPEFDFWSARGFECAVAPASRYAAALVFLPRSKAQARDMVARIADVTDGPVFLDGQKTDGIDSLIRDLRKSGAELSAPTTKAHGKLIAIYAAELSHWRAAGTAVGEGLQTTAGVFSADAIDPGSALLADALPKNMQGMAADLGAGWGFLASRVLQHNGITECHLFEADHVALDLAQANVTDERAHFHWADVTQPDPEYRGKFNNIVMNPPFHTARAATPELGNAFIAAASQYLARNGTMWMVANRHLPYEADLRRHFATVTELAAPPAFKLFRAERPKPPGKN